MSEEPMKFEVGKYYAGGITGDKYECVGYEDNTPRLRHIDTGVVCSTDAPGLYVPWDEPQMLPVVEAGAVEEGAAP